MEFILGGDPMDRDSFPELKVEFLTDKKINISHDFMNYRHYFYEIILQKMGPNNQWRDL